MHYRGFPSWPPNWAGQTALKTNAQKEKSEFSGGEYNPIFNREQMFSFIDYEELSYIGDLTVDDHAFCSQIGRFLQTHRYNCPIPEIGSLDLSDTEL